MHRFFALAVVFSLIFSIPACSNSPSASDKTDTKDTNFSDSVKDDELETDEDAIPANPDVSDVIAEPPPVADAPVFFTATGPPESEETPAPEPTASAGAPDVSLQERVEDDFFSDAAFIGNSLIEGLRLYSGLTTCDFYAATSMSVLGVGSANAITLNNGGSGTIYQGVAQETYGKLYILLGINEIGYVTSSFKEIYAGMLDTLREIQPDAVIYIMSLTPVSASKSAADPTFSMARVTEYNEALYELAEEKGCYYIDLIDALSDDAGFLPANVTSDGIHFAPDHYKVWLEYLRTHYII